MASVVLVSPAVFPEVARAGVEDARREVQRIVDELERLQSQADKLAEDYAVAVDTKNQLDDEIVDAEARVAAKEAELSELRGDLAEVAIRSFTGSGTDVLGPLFSSATDYGDQLQSDQYSRVALSVGTSTTDDLDELISDLAAERADLQAKRDQADQLAQTISSNLEQTEQLTAQYVQARADAEARLGAEIAAEEERRAAAEAAAHEAAVAAAQAQAQAQTAAASTGDGGGGGGGGSTATGGSTGGASTGGGSSGGGGSAAPAPAPAAPANVPAVSGLAGIAVNAAIGQQGVPYRYATSNPGVSFDCSGLTHYAWGQAGVYLPRNSRAQAAATPRIPQSAVQPGDLIFYYSPISHVGIYIGGGSYIHAPATGDVVKISPVRWSKVTAIGRPG